MGSVIVVYKLMPSSPEAFEQVKKEAAKIKHERLEEEPIAFGLKAVKFTAIIPDAEGEIDRLEEKLRKIKGVQGVENLICSRCL